MTKKNLSSAAWKLRATAALVLALALSTFPATFSRAVKAQAPAKASAQTPAKATTSPAAESKGGQKEGIKVHGHWTIDVRNPDGTLVTHREFENHLHDGANALSNFLSRSTTVGEWKIKIAAGNNGAPLPCTRNNGIPVYCVILEVNSLEDSGPNFAFKNLQIMRSGPTFSLSGTATAQRASQINILDTEVTEMCPQPPGTCVQGGSTWFTHVLLAAPVNGSCAPDTQCAVDVVAGQIIQVKVVISFS